jgi:hypothetical protein
LDGFPLNNSMKKRKILYLGTALLTFCIGLALVRTFVLPKRTFEVISRDGAVYEGPSGKRVSMAVTTWVSSDGVTVEEVTVDYSSVDEARRDFELRSNRAERISGQNPASNSERFVGKNGSSFRVITLEGKSLHYVQGRDLDAVLAFEASWLKFEWW